MPLNINWITCADLFLKSYLWLDINIYMDVINAFNFNSKSLNSAKFSMKTVTGFYFFFLLKNYWWYFKVNTHWKKGLPVKKNILHYLRGVNFKACLNVLGHWNGWSAESFGSREWEIISGFQNTTRLTSKWGTI